jgi:diguanylate cyclase (GGDEF)-like protein
VPDVLDRRRALVAAADPVRQALERLFAAGQVAGWEAVTADGLDRARFMLQMEPCDALVLDGGLYRGGDAGLAWLAGPAQTPVLFLAGAAPGGVAEALEQGAAQWLPRDLALTQPRLLAAALGAAARQGELRGKAEQAREALHDCRQQVDRLVHLLWEASPVEGRAGWFPQRHMLERLEEEVARARRHGGPLAVVLGEVEGGGHGRLTPRERQQLAEWTAERVVRAKRRGDVAGRYGPHGFLLLLPRTAAAGAAGCCRRLKGVLEEPPALAEGALPPLHASFGVAAFSEESASVKGLLRQAEERLEQAKGAGNGLNPSHSGPRNGDAEPSHPLR